MAEEQETLREAVQLCGAALKRGEVTFALAGGYAAWAHGAPEPDHDADFVIVEPDIELAKATLTDAGLKVVQPPEDWLFKAFHRDALVDVIFRICGQPVPRELIDRAAYQDVLSVHMPVLDPTDVLTTKMNALTEQTCDYARLLPTARALRERVDWERLEADTAASDYAAALLFLLRRLQVAPG